ncbi:hypothetical protein ABO04_04595 [Nitrosomonas sp. HPC101]|uniref:AOC03_06830 family ribosome hibernation factor n=1 Tax=Nitrosomonas sp. HPC101 TaxID=1658667 RepID=UPI00136D7B35|nr:hypothetical protein [Nitrosomonas sp. HPC101]MXS85212.1 hypothetical protein [Nitrosomonas sp. HPC101]
MNLESLLNQLNNHQNDLAISILLPTHRTFPDNKQDAIALKNLIKEAEDRLNTQLDKREVEVMIDAIHKKIDALDHNYNLDSLGIFANRHGVTAARFPFAVGEQRVIIDDTFAVRDLVRAINDAVHYHVLVISRTSARLIEAFNDRPIHEFDSKTVLRTGSFPAENPFLFAAKGLDRAQIPNDAGNLKEFFNRVDKSLQEIQNNPENKRLPVIVVGDSRNVAFFKEVCDQPTDIVGAVTTVPDLKIAAEKLIPEVQTVLTEYRLNRAKTALQHLAQARNAHQLLTDFSMILRAIIEGNAARLFVRQGYIQPGVIDFDQKIVTVHDAAATDVTDDVVDTFIELVMQQGGEICFLSAEQLGEEKPLSLQTRY